MPTAMIGAVVTAIVPRSQHREATVIETGNSGIPATDPPTTLGPSTLKG